VLVVRDGFGDILRSRAELLADMDSAHSSTPRWTKAQIM
jgi:hypothetical protein